MLTKGHAEKVTLFINEDTQRHMMARRDQAIMIAIVDTAANLSARIPVAEETLDTWLLATSDVRPVRVRK